MPSTSADTHANTVVRQMRLDLAHLHITSVFCYYHDNCSCVAADETSLASVSPEWITISPVLLDLFGCGSILGGFWAAAAEATGDTCVCKWFGEARPTALLWRGMKAVWRRDHNTAASEQLRNLSSRCLSQGAHSPSNFFNVFFFWNLKEISWIIVLTKSRSYFSEARFLPNLSQVENSNSSFLLAFPS